MKAIQISSFLEKAFLQAAAALDLSVELLRKCAFPGEVVYRVTTPGISQHQLFLLGALTWKLAYADCSAPGLHNSTS